MENSNFSENPVSKKLENSSTDRNTSDVIDSIDPMPRSTSRKEKTRPEFSISTSFSKNSIPSESTIHSAFVSSDSPEKAADFHLRTGNLRRNSIPPPINVADANLVAQKLLKQKNIQYSPSPPSNKTEHSLDPHESNKISIGLSSDRYSQVLETKLQQRKNEDTPSLLDSTFSQIDFDISNLERPNSGCTAAVAYVEITPSKNENDGKSYKLFCSNVGDARAVLCRNGKAIRLSYDHKGDDPNESNRVSDNGGLMLNNRVNGVLAVTRSLGDHSMKKVVVGRPYVSSTVLQKNDSLLILACDGLWDVCSDQKAVDIALKQPTAQEASDELLKYALDNLSSDNLSIMVIRFSYF
ncbi:hypothetical protein BB560_001252 [Smittium megazygosporum]|uniref:PPM-type phosphatase domain-containing protein n=1 Tax=Smittium megazygosporum TaxID=133381 RepID=A0A2T9ZI37_9FUNG|nr:hypothetical protein BB560_001252 [Smittium megazygosporum]